MKVAPLHILILAGGHSTRMGTDKAQLTYHGLPQTQWLPQLLQPLGLPIFLSLNPAQATGKPDTPQVIVDQFPDKGPMGGLLSAHWAYPEVAWVAVAIDWPLLRRKTIEFLMENRKPKCQATCLKHPERKFPEPLLAIYEPGIFKEMQQAFEQEKLGLIRLLRACHIHTTMVPDPRELLNANSPSERQLALELLKSGRFSVN
ncbi:MAG: NTP transferase domain-containing protein [Bacteroidota bacterium]